MTIEEAIHILDNLKPTNTKSSFDAYVVGKAITMAIEALKKEPFINKPCVSCGECEHDKQKVLDKIRAEIEAQEKWLAQAGYNAYNMDIAFSSIKSVLAESEG